jgi:predicted nucleotidyltransferase
MAKKIYDKIIEIIFEKPSYHFHLRELARLANVHPNSVKATALELKKENIAKIERKKHLTEIFADLESKNFAKKKREFNFMNIYQSGIVEHLAEAFDPEAVSVIGSYSRGEDIESSDIDVVIVKPLKATKKSIQVDKFEEKLKRKIHLIATDYNEMSDEFYINLINGMLLYGHLAKKK